MLFNFKYFPWTPSHCFEFLWTSLQKRNQFTIWLLLNEDSSWNKQSVSGWLFGADNRPKHYQCTSSNVVIVTLGTGKSVVKALEVLKQHSVEGKKVIVLTLFATPDSKLISLLHILTCPLPLPSSGRPSPANAETIVGPMRNPNMGQQTKRLLEPLCELSKAQKGTKSHLADFFRCQNCWTHQLQSKVHCSSTLTEKMHGGFLCLLA